MTTKVKIIHNTPLSKAQFEGVVDLHSGMANSDAQASVVGLRQYINAYINGARKGSLVCNVGEVSAIGSIVLAGEPTSGDTFSVANVTFTGTSGTNGSAAFHIGTSVTATAANIVTVVNANTSANKIVTASSNAGTVVFTANSSGNSGNGLQLSSALTNGTAGVTAFTGGTNGDSFSLSLHG